MSQAEPIPDLQYGAGNWQDFINNWREKDAEYLQARTILRFATTAQRDTYLPAPGTGQFAWLNDVGAPYAGQEMLMYRSKGPPAAWKYFKPLPQAIVPFEDGTKVTLSHINATGKGLTFGATTPWGISVDLPFSVLGVLAVDSTTVTVKTQGPGAKVTTDSTATTAIPAGQMLVDKPLSVPGITLTGGTNMVGDVIVATGKSVTFGSVKATTATIPDISVSGVLTGNKYTGSEATIGGVTLKNGQVTGTLGIVDQHGIFYGDGSSAIMRYWPTGGSYASGSSYLRVYDNEIQAQGGVGSVFDIYTQMQIRETAANNQGQVRWLDSSGTVKGYIGPVVVSNTAQDAAAWPNGTIWIDPS